MSLSFNPNGVYSIQPLQPQPPLNSASHAKRGGDSAVAAEAVLDVDRAKRRSDEYVAALRELKLQNQDPKRTLATQTFLDIAHYEGGLQIIDVFA